MRGHPSHLRGRGDEAQVPRDAESELLAAVRSARRSARRASPRRRRRKPAAAPAAPRTARHPRFATALPGHEAGRVHAEHVARDDVRDGVEGEGARAHRQGRGGHQKRHRAVRQRRDGDGGHRNPTSAVAIPTAALVPELVTVGVRTAANAGAWSRVRVAALGRERHQPGRAHDAEQKKRERDAACRGRRRRRARFGTGPWRPPRRRPSARRRSRPSAPARCTSASTGGTSASTANRKLWPAAAGSPKSALADAERTEGLRGARRRGHGARRDAHAGRGPVRDQAAAQPREERRQRQAPRGARAR